MNDTEVVSNTTGVENRTEIDTSRKQKEVGYLNEVEEAIITV